jgi:hypothetical protein
LPFQSEIEKMGITRNVGIADRLVRVALSMLLGISAVWERHEVVGWLAGIAAVLLLLSASLGT